MSSRLYSFARSPEGIIWICGIIFVGCSLWLTITNTDFSNVNPWQLFVHYSGLTGQGMKEGAAFFILLYSSVVLFRIIIFLFVSNHRNVDPRSFFSRLHLSRLLHSFRRELGAMLWIAIPIVFTLLAIFFSIAIMSTVHHDTLRDELLLSWDFALLGGTPFLTLTATPWPRWLASAVVFSYSYLVVAIVLMAFYLFQRKRNFGREYAAAIMLGTVVMLPGWLVLPALAPQGRLIDNNYRLEIPENVRLQIEQYNSQPEVSAFLETIRELNAPLHNLPVSTFPSTHITWGSIAVYYLWRSRERLLFWLFLPFFIFSSIGTVYLAEHYFVDISAGIVAAALTVLLLPLVMGRSRTRQLRAAEVREVAA